MEAKAAATVTNLKSMVVSLIWLELTSAFGFGFPCRITLKLPGLYTFWQGHVDCTWVRRGTLLEANVTRSWDQKQTLKRMREKFLHNAVFNEVT